MISHRASQFFHALTAHVSAEDRAFLETWLPEETARAFFDAMTVADQCHALRTARTAEQLRLASPDGATMVDRRLLIRASLLHDIGRQKGDMGTCGKVLAVLLTAAFPRWSKKRGENAAGGWLSALLHVYYHHPEKGANMLRRIGLPDEAALTVRHHAPAAGDDPPELLLLRQADQMN